MTRVLKFRAKQLGAHMHCSVFVGASVDNLALSGTLVLRVDEWETFAKMIDLGAREVRGLTAFIETTGT